MLNGPYGTRIFLPQIAQIDTEEKHHRCLYNKNTNYFKEHESRESIETRRSPTDRREVMTTERKHRRCLISHE